MRRLYITGLVRVADTVRRSLAAPISAEQKAELRRLVTNSLTQVNSILAANGATARQLPAPSRRAFEFLAGVDFEAVSPAAQPGNSSSPGGAVTMKRLTAFWEGILHRLATPIDGARADSVRNSIATSSEGIRRHLAEHGLRTQDLKRPSRQAYAWLRLFAIPENFEAYLAAVRLAHPILHAAMADQPYGHAPLLVAFRPMAGLCRMRRYRSSTRVAMPTPMIRFTAALFRDLAAAMFCGGSRESVLKATQDEAYQEIQAELDAIEGLAEQAAGMHHDLVGAFERVAAKYFAGRMERPRLTWNRMLTGRKFGHYDPLTDTVMLSCTLDHAEVPRFVIDFVMYHELLHKKLGADWRNGRQAVHTAAFRAEERRFEQHAAAEAALKKLALRHA